MNWLLVWRGVLDFGWLSFLLLFLRHLWCDRQIFVNAQFWHKTKGHITAWTWTAIGHSIWPKIDYSYDVHDKIMTGNELFLTMKYNNPNSKYSRQIAYAIAIAFKEERDIDVYYNPNHPEQSVLDVTMPIKFHVLLILISMLVVVHVGFMIWRYWS